jgi:hypothetical protein
LYISNINNLFSLKKSKTLDYHNLFAIIIHLYKGFYVVKILVFFLLFDLTSVASNLSVEDLCKEMDIVPASKAVIQWERIFSSDKRKKKYKIDQLAPAVQQQLKNYLIHHAADSSQPMVPGL